MAARRAGLPATQIATRAVGWSANTAKIAQRGFMAMGAESFGDGKRGGRAPRLMAPEEGAAFLDGFVEAALKPAGRRGPCALMPQCRWCGSVPMPSARPEEQVWGELREKFFGNRASRSTEAAVKRIVEGLRHLEASPQLLASLTHRSWINSVIPI